LHIAAQGLFVIFSRPDDIPAAMESIVTKTAPKLASRRLAVVADPDADTRALHRAWLEQNGWGVEEAEDGRDALVTALLLHPTLVVTETALPFIDGCDLCKLLRRDVETRGIQIVVVTADTRSERIERVRSAGADALLFKPCALESFVEETERRWKRAPAMPVATPPSARASSKSQSHQRFVTARPPCLPPLLVCPECDSALIYDVSQIGGVSATYGEQWDYFLCGGRCSRVRYQYRHRTRSLRRVS
jgi:CheY-like chemotaxis protein